VLNFEGKLMAENVSVSGPVKIQSDSAERVAYDLMVRILTNESSVSKDRRYYFDLYSQCRQIVNGVSANELEPPIFVR
jgi:hypothetical protein